MQDTFNKKIKIFSIDYFLFFIFILVSARAAFFTRSDSWLVFFTLITGIRFVYLKQKFNKKLLYVFIIFLSFVIFFFIKYETINLSEYLRLSVKIIYAYFIIKILNEKFVDFYIDLIYKLALISIPFYVLQLIDSNIIFSYNKLFPQFGQLNNSANSILFHIQKGALLRNSGFAWEPGVFGAFLTIAIYFKLLKNNFYIDKKLLIMIIVLLTTLSTTAYINLIIFIILYYFNKGKNLLFFIIRMPIIILMVIYIIQLDFVSQKINEQFDTSFYIYDNLNKRSNKNLEFASLGRFGSMWADFNDLKTSPIFGTGLEHEHRAKNEYLFLQRTNGLTNFIVRFGILGFVFFIYLVNKSFIILFPDKSKIYKYVYLGMLLIILFSNPIFFTPFFLSLNLQFLRQK